MPEKISSFATATLPLAGHEVLVGLQGGENVLFTPASVAALALAGGATATEADIAAGTSTSLFASPAAVKGYVDSQVTGSSSAVLATVVQQISAVLVAAGAKAYADNTALNADNAPALGAIGLVNSTGQLWRKSAAAGSAGWTLLGYIFASPVGLSLLGSDVTSLLPASGVAPQVLLLNAAETGQLLALTDAAQKMTLSVDAAGSLHVYAWAAGTISGGALAAGSVGYSNLDGTVAPFLGSFLPPESGYLFAITDVNNALIFGVTTAGGIVLAAGSVGTATLAPGAVTEAKLDPPIARTAVPHVGDVVEVAPDDWRGKISSAAVQTSTEGSLWAPFPSVLTPNLRGVNLSGTSLQFRRSARLPIRGKRYAGAWSPNAASGQAANTNIGFVYAFSGSLSLSATAASALPGTGAVGNFYRYFSLGTNLTYGGQTLVFGDIVVWDGSTWAVKKSPAFSPGTGTHGNRLEDDWWVVTAAGTWEGVTFAVGDRIVYLGYDLGFGELWYKGNAANGELFYYGVFTPGSFASPNTVAQGDLWQAASAGTDATLGLTVATADYVARDAGVWGDLPGDTITTVASGAMIPGLRCFASASEWEVRRTDLSATVVPVVASCRRQNSPRRAVDTIVLRSDSMFYYPNIGPQLQALVAPRTVNVVTRAGAFTRNIQSTLENEIIQGGDANRGAVEFLWHGQNNQPTTVGDLNWAQITSGVDAMRNLIGSRDRRHCFLSILGQNLMTYNSGLGRIQVAQWETGFGAGGILAALESWYQATFPGQWLSPRNILMAAAGSTQDVRVPAASVGGAQLTEAQTAAMYGWAPMSFFLDLAGAVMPVAFSALSLKGYWSSNGLPTGGSPNDCYTRTGGTTAISGLTSNVVGNLLVNVAGTWGEYSFDNIHLSPNANRGGQYIAAALAAYLTTNTL